MTDVVKRSADGDAGAAALALLARRAADATVCPSEVARALAAAGDADWRGRMPAVHTAIDRLVGAGVVRLRWRDRELAERAGPYRIAHGTAADRSEAG